MTVRIALVVGDHRTAFRVEGQLLAAVDDPAARGDRIDTQFRLLERERELDRPAIGALPVLQIATPSVRQVVIRGAIRRVSPDPDHVEETVRTPDRALGIGIAEPPSLEERRVDKARSGLRLHVVAIVEAPTVAAAAVAIGEQKIVPRVVQESRVGTALLSASGHREALERRDVARFPGAEVNERHAVHVAGQVEAPARPPPW